MRWASTFCYEGPAGQDAPFHGRPAQASGARFQRLDLDRMSSWTAAMRAAWMNRRLHRAGIVVLSHRSSLRRTTAELHRQLKSRFVKDD
jgi:hypothetical protein